MSNRVSERYREKVPASLPPDIVVVIGATLLSAALLVAEIPGNSALRFAIGLPLFVFLPGYGIVAALFPERNGTRGTDTDESSRQGPSLFHRGITPLERFALAIGTSVTTVPLLGLLLNVTLGGLTRPSITLTLTVFTVGIAGVAGYRRAELAEHERFRVPLYQWTAALVRPADRTTLFANVVLVIAVVALVGTFAYTTTTPKERYTEFYVLSEDDAGRLVADEYPQQLERGEPVTLHVGVGNRERTDVTYTVVVQLQEVDEGGQPVRVRELDRFRVGVDAGEDSVEPHSITPTMAGDRLRLTYLLYIGEPTERPQTLDAYRRVHIWVDVAG